VTIRRVAIIFDDTARPETTGVYCRRALRSLVEVEHLLPRDLQRVPRRGFDLYLRIDDGLEFPWPEELRPSACWAIDTHLNFPWYRDQAGAFSRVFAAQRDGAEKLLHCGVTSATWLPLACDPEVHRRHDVDKQFDLCFVGNVLPGPRQELLELLRARFPNTFVGRRYFEEMARAYSASRLVFNRSVLGDVNMRVFEAAACGSLLLTNDLAANGQEELFRSGEHLITYRSAEELLDKASWYLERDEERERIASAGRAEAVARHTYRHRMGRILAEMEREPARVAVAAGSLPPGKAEDLPQAAAAGTPEPSAPAVGRPAPGYFEHVRPELLGLIPSTARRVLDVGCGAGRLGEALKARQEAEVVGIEMCGEAARAARGRLDAVHVGDAERLELPFAPGSFDAAVCGDVLEHLREPGLFLRRVRGWLRPGGVLVASIPNARHHGVLRMLLRGDWTYEPAGLLDRTHLRFFTRGAILRLLEDSGFSLERLGIVPGPGHEGWVRLGRPGEVSVGGLLVRGLSPGQAEEFFAYQFLVTAVPAARDANQLGAGRATVG
jgi:2-polyprenyl-3-methyl-5-hydroxy-6-metoxy-1,4-benzoquinol methylase